MDFENLSSLGTRRKKETDRQPRQQSQHCAHLPGYHASRHTAAQKPGTVPDDQHCIMYQLFFFFEFSNMAFLPSEKNFGSLCVFSFGSDTPSLPACLRSLPVANRRTRSPCLLFPRPRRPPPAFGAGPEWRADAGRRRERALATAPQGPSPQGRPKNLNPQKWANDENNRNPLDFREIP